MGYAVKLRALLTQDYPSCLRAFLPYRAKAQQKGHHAQLWPDLFHKLTTTATKAGDFNLSQ